MLTAQQKAQLKTFHNNLSDASISPDDERYVAVFSSDTDLPVDDPIDDIATNIDFSESSSVNLLTGPRGSGKSTELKRLSAQLTENDCEVFHVDMSQYMNLTTAVDVTDFLISVMAAFSDIVFDRFGKDFSHTSYPERLATLLNTEIDIESTSFKTNVGTIKASLKGDPSFKKQLQDCLKGHVSQIVEQAHEFAESVVAFIRKQAKNPDKKVVLLVDSVEQIRGVGSDAELVYKSVENLFSAHSDSLRFPTMHVVYTIPPYMSALAPGVARVLGGNAVQTLPSIHVRTTDNLDDEHGLQIMHAILSKRCATLNEILTTEQVKQLARLSGGDIRNYFRFVRNCLVKAGSSSGCDLPLADHLFERAINPFRREMFIPLDDLEWLRKIDESSDHKLTSKESLAQFARFLDSGLVLNYRNGKDWYGVNPLLRELLEKE